MAYAQLLKRIENKRARVGIIGMGYVGLPLLQTFCKAGFSCLGFDVDARKIKRLGIPDVYVAHGPRDWQLAHCGIDAEGLAQAIRLGLS